MPRPGVAMGTTAPRSLAAGEGLACDHCGAELAAGDRVCAECGARRARICSCGTRLGAETASCPNCGASTSAASRSHRRGRSARVQRALLLHSAAKGAAAAVAAALLLNVVVSALAQRQSPDGNLPAGFGERVSAAATTVWQAVVAFAQMLCALPLGALLLVAVVGAGCGVACYLVGAGHWPWMQNADASKRRHSRRRRERADERSAGRV